MIRIIVGKVGRLRQQGEGLDSLGVSWLLTYTVTKHVPCRRTAPGPGYAEVSETDTEASEVTTEARVGRMRGSRPYQQQQEEIYREKEGHE